MRNFLLFDAATLLSPDTRSRPRNRPESPTYTRGYFAFPPAGLNRPDSPHIASVDDAQAELQRTLDEADAIRRAKEAEREERCARDSQAREGRLARERAEALIGEIHWVRLGFSLRDELGRKDVGRTEELRKEIRLREEEGRIMARWDQYETRWRRLLASGSPVTFQDIPWPLPDTPSSPSSLDDAAIEDFIFATFSVRTNTVTRRDRLRASILRWHPDKVTTVVSRVVPDDVDAVREGVNVVFRRLKALQDTANQV